MINLIQENGGLIILEQGGVLLLEDPANTTTTTPSPNTAPYSNIELTLDVVATSTTTTTTPTPGTTTTTSTTPAPLAAPSWLTVSNNPAQITANWGGVAGADSYALIYRYWNEPDGSETVGIGTYQGKFVIPVGVNEDIFEFNIPSGMPLGNALYFRIAAIKNGVYSAYTSNIVSATPSAATTTTSTTTTTTTGAPLPTIPVISAVAGNGQFTINRVSGGVGATDWMVYWGNTPYTGDLSTWLYSAQDFNGSSITLLRSNGLAVYAIVRAFNAQGHVDSNAVTTTPIAPTTTTTTTTTSTTTTPAPTTTTLPPEPKTLKINYGGMSATLTDNINGSVRFHIRGETINLVADDTSFVRINTPLGVIGVR